MFKLRDKSKKIIYLNQKSNTDRRFMYQIQYLLQRQYFFDTKQINTLTSGDSSKTKQEYPRRVSESGVDDIRWGKKSFAPFLFYGKCPDTYRKRSYTLIFQIFNSHRKNNFTGIAYL